MNLYNKLSRSEAIEKLMAEPFKRKTVSFYRYFTIQDTEVFRNNLFIAFDKIVCLGRIYVAREGVNAQMSVPEHYVNDLIELLKDIPGLNGVPLKWAVEDNGKSFHKLIIKVRKYIVADGLSIDDYDVSNVGKHLTAMEFHELCDADDTIVIDMRNHYESEIGHFKNAYCPDADTFREAIKIVETEFDKQKNKRILLYCTGGIRCEKASAYLKHKGFNDVNQLYGGIIEYAQQIKHKGFDSKFIGKNFVFDNRLGESINGQVISKCHQCGNPSDTHTNCANDDCHLLFIQCAHCADTYQGCCSDDCREINQLPEEEKKAYRVLRHQKYAGSKIFKSRLRPVLNKQLNQEHFSDIE